MINPTHIHISAAWSQHSGRDSLGLCSAVSCGCPHSPVPWPAIAQGKPGGTAGTAKFQEAALVRGSTCSSACRSTPTNLSSLPKPSWALQQRAKACWALTLHEPSLCHRSEEKMFFWAVRNNEIWKVLFKHSQPLFLKQKMWVTAFSPYHILSTYEFRIICVLERWGRGGAGIGMTAPFRTSQLGSILVGVMHALHCQNPYLDEVGGSLCHPLFSATVILQHRRIAISSQISSRH